MENVNETGTQSNEKFGFDYINFYKVRFIPKQLAFKINKHIPGNCLTIYTKLYNKSINSF